MTNAETAKEKFEAEAKKFREEAEIARKTKEAVLEEKNDMTKKHEVFVYILAIAICLLFLRFVNKKLLLFVYGFIFYNFSGFDFLF